MFLVVAWRRRVLSFLYFHGAGSEWLQFFLRDFLRVEVSTSSSPTCSVASVHKTAPWLLGWTRPRCSSSRSPSCCCSVLGASSCRLHKHVNLLKFAAVVFEFVV